MGVGGEGESLCWVPSSSGAGVKGMGWPLAALMSERSKRVVAWKSESVKRISMYNEPI